MNRETQCKWLLAKLKEGNRINTFTAYRHGITRLSARIYDLRQEGNDIRSEMVTVTRRDDDGDTYSFKEYWLAQEHEEEAEQ